MKINFKDEKTEDIYKVGNVIKDECNILYLITTNSDGGYSVVDFRQ